MIYLFVSPFGDITYDWHAHRCQHLWLNPDADQQSFPDHDDPVSCWLNHYFNGVVKALPPLHAAHTDFQQRMRDALIKIPSGEVRSYAEIADTLHTSPRAIGQALAANRLPIVIPCHRIVAAKGLGGFHYGQTWKMNLLKLEGYNSP